MILVTGGAGFIGANFVHYWLKHEEESIVNLDKLTYAGNLENLAALEGDARHTFVKGDIGDREAVTALLAETRPRAIVNFAAETHVDRSISGPEPFLESNVIGTCRLLDAALEYWKGLPEHERQQFLFVQISTDEVYGSLEKGTPPATEESAYRPSSPYAASKAAADHYVRAYNRTYGLPTVITHSTNNFGPYQFPEKLLPLFILNARDGKPLPIYGDGQNIRNWLYVDDHCEALRLIIKQGKSGETYNIASDDEMTNLELVHKLCTLIDRKLGSKGSHSLITFVEDRPGHDKRYAMSADKVKRELKWKPAGTFDEKLENTLEWYLEHGEWLGHLQSGEYKKWIETHYKGKVR